MKLLIVTQAVDTEDPILGFFVHWIAAFAKKVERVEVICLREGKHDLPKNVRVHSLGKEKQEGSRQQAAGRKFRYAIRFLGLAWRLRRDYDAVFVHMNQEYVLIAGWFWKLLGKRVALWRNHYAGSWLTDMAALFCTKVFYTSEHSYTARYHKAVRMPVGVATEQFKPDERVHRKPHSILFLARMSPSKRPELLLDALAMLAREGATFTATFAGSPAPQDAPYYEGLKARAEALGFGDTVSFIPAVTNSEAADLYRTHEIFVNASPSGMLDKTIFEAAACGCRVFAASDDWKEMAGEDGFFAESSSLFMQLQKALQASPDASRAREESIVASQSLEKLIDQVLRTM